MCAGLEYSAIYDKWRFIRKWACVFSIINPCILVVQLLNFLGENLHLLSFCDPTHYSIKGLKASGPFVLQSFISLMLDQIPITIFREVS